MVIYLTLSEHPSIIFEDTNEQAKNALIIQNTLKKKSINYYKSEYYRTFILTNKAMLFIYFIR
jgi:hypothetical protein